MNTTPPPIGNGTNPFASLQDEKAKPKNHELIPESAGIFSTLEYLLKSPAALHNRLVLGSYAAITVKLSAACLTCFFCYGLIAGSFSGGEQIYLAGGKALAGIVITSLICFPSFYIFSCLGGANISVGSAFGLLVSSMTLIALLLIGFSPVIWVFSQSTNSLGFMGFLHIAIWMISVSFGLKLIGKGLNLFESKNSSYTAIWGLIFILTSLQMMTALRPIIGKSAQILPKEKMFFLENWGNSFDAPERR